MLKLLHCGRGLEGRLRSDRGHGNGPREGLYVSWRSCSADQVDAHPEVNITIHDDDNDTDDSHRQVNQSDCIEYDTMIILNLCMGEDSPFIKICKFVLY